MLPPRWGSIHYINRRILHDDCSQQFTMPTGINMTFCQKPLIKDTNTGIPTLSECSMSSIDSALPSRSDSGRTAITGYVRNFVIVISTTQPAGDIKSLRMSINKMNISSDQANSIQWREEQKKTVTDINLNIEEYENSSDGSMSGDEFDSTQKPEYTTQTTHSESELSDMHDLINDQYMMQREANSINDVTNCANATQVAETQDVQETTYAVQDQDKHDAKDFNETTTFSEQESLRYQSVNKETALSGESTDDMCDPYVKVRPKVDAKPIQATKMDAVVDTTKPKAATESSKAPIEKTSESSKSRSSQALPTIHEGSATEIQTHREYRSMLKADATIH